MATPFFSPFRIVHLLLGIVMAACQLSTVVSAADPPLTVYPSFRVETELFSGETTSPQSRHLILFDAGSIYEIPIGQGSIVTVFDIPRQRVLLCHKINRVKTEIATDTLIQMAADLRTEAAGSKDQEALGLSAKVVPGTTPDAYVVQFGSNRYDVTTQTVTDPAIAEAYAAFTSWALRLNVARHLGPPPFARMILADYLAAEQRLPKQLKLEVRRGFKTRTYRSESLIVERLSEPDRQKIRDVGGMISLFNAVDFTDFPAE